MIVALLMLLHFAIGFQLVLMAERHGAKSANQKIFVCISLIFMVFWPFGLVVGAIDYIFWKNDLYR